MSFSQHSFNIMYVFTIVLGFICIQSIKVASTLDSNEVQFDDQSNPFQTETIYDPNDLSTKNSEHDKENDDYDRRETSFLRFGRQYSPAAGSFLRFGRDVHRGGSFLRFGRSNSLPHRLGRSGHNTGTFLRFGRGFHLFSPRSNPRFPHKGEFLRFG